MPLYKNTAGQQIAVTAIDTSDGSLKTGDAANITAQISKDGGASAATDDVNPTELDATNHPGVYLFDLTQAETNADQLVLTVDSATADISCGDPIEIYTDDVVNDVAALNDLSSADVNAACDTALTDYDAPTKTEIDNGFAGLNDVSSADVQSAVDGALDAANTELASVPTTAGSVREFIQYLFARARNKVTVTGSAETVYKEDGTTELGSASLSDDGTTFTKDETS